jgi:hypothetical protein
MMTEEFISREAAMKAANEWVSEACMAPVMRISRLLDKLAKVPAADVAEVVRCKNCKWFADNNGGEWYGCQMFQVVQITPEDAPKPDDFCSYGEYQTNTGGVTK